MQKELIGPDEISEILFCTRRDIKKFRAQGMPCIHINGGWMFNVKDCQAWFAVDDTKPKQVFAKPRAHKPRAHPDRPTFGGLATQNEALRHLRISYKTLVECRTAGMPYTVLHSKCYEYSIKKCVEWLESSDDDFGIRWVAKWD